MTRETARRLTLVRHAKSDWADASLDDVDRPLNARGARDAPEMAARLLAAGLVPTRMVSSPALRALTTAHTFAKAFGYPASRIRVAQEAYLARPAELLDIVRELGGRARHLMLFGHNPGISAFAVELTGDRSLSDLPTCAVVSMLAPVADWSALAPGGARLDRCDFPRNRPA